MGGERSVTEEQAPKRGRINLYHGPKKGIYETSYGNAALVSGPRAKTAYDLDMGERIPICEVNLNKFLRKVEPSDYPRSGHYD